MPGEERRREAGAADPRVDDPAVAGGQHVGLREGDAGLRVGDHRDVGLDAAQLAVPHRRRRRHLGGLVGGHREHMARAAARAVQERARRRGLPVVVVPVGRGRAPAGLPQVLAVRADAEARAADRGDPRARVGEAGRARADDRAVVAVVARGEVDARALHGRLLEHRVQRHDLAARDERLGQAPRVRDDVGDVVVDGVVQRQVEAAGVVRGADVDDLRPRRDGVCPLDVERLLDVPALRLGRVLREPLRAGRDDLAVVEAGRAVVVGTVAAIEAEAVREVGDVVADRRREERAGDRDRLPAAVEAGGVQPVDAVRRVDLGGLSSRR